MATNAQIMGLLAAASGPMSRAQLEEKVGESYRKFQSQLDRATKAGFLEDTGDHHYTLTDKGREEALKKGEFKDIEDIENLIIDESKQAVPGSAEEEGASKIAVATTEKQQFLRLGKLSGVTPLQLIHQTADYVWEGGDYKDMNWVAQAMQELGLDKDIRTRWWHCWRAKMRQPIPSDLSPEFLATESKKTEGKKDEKKRDYILNEDDLPTYVGENNGDIDHQEAVDLAKIRAARRKDTTPASTTSPIDDVIKIVNLVRSSEGGKAAGKSYVVKPGEGGYSVEEVEPGKPLLIPQPESTRASPSYFVDGDGKVQQMEPGRPLVIFKESPKVTTAGPLQYLVDKSTGEVKEITPGQPVVIIRDSGPGSQLTPIQVTDKDGKPMVLDLSTFIRLEEHRDNQRRVEESHQTKIEIAKTFKDLLNKASTALTHMAEGEEK